MNKQEIISLIADPDFQTGVRGLTEKSLIETLSFVAVVLSAIIALGALTVASVQLRKQLQEWEKGRGAFSAQLTLASNELSTVAQGIREDHRRSRREFSISLIQYWVSNHRHESQSARNFVEELSEEQCKDLFYYRPLKVDRSKIDLLVSCLQHSFKEASEQTVLENGFVQPVYAAHIRHTVVAYLNSLEVVMIAWFHDIADQEIIAKEFEFLVKPLERVAALEIFRTAVGRESFVGIDEFVSFLRRRDKERERQSGTGIKLPSSD